MTGAEPDYSAVPAVVCRQVTYRFGTRTAVDQLDLEIHEGEIFGLLGPNGAGKTTTIRMLTTLLPCPRGSIEVFGVDVAARPMDTRRLLGYVPQQLSADATLTGRENMMLYTRLFDVPRRSRKAVTEEALDAMGQADAADQMVRTYSGGMIRRLELAQALVNRPRLLVLDEPTIGLDPVGRSDVWERVQALRRDAGMTVLLTTHYMDEADHLCDRLAMMHRGVKRAEGTPQSLKAALGPDTTLEDVFRHYAGDELEAPQGGEYREVRTARRTARRVG